MRRREFLLTSASIVGATSIGAVAFTSASAERDVSVDIVADSAGPITLTDGNTEAVSVTDGQLVIDTPDLNGGGSFTYGSTTNPSTTQAFSMTNNGGGDRDFTFSLTGTSPLTLKIYDDTGTLVGDVTTSTDTTASAVASGVALYAVLVFDTSGLTSNDTIDGQFTIDAVTPS